MIAGSINIPIRNKPSRLFDSLVHCGKCWSELRHFAECQCARVTPSAATAKAKAISWAIQICPDNAFFLTLAKSLKHRIHPQLHWDVRTVRESRPVMFRAKMAAESALAIFKRATGRYDTACVVELAT